MIFTGHFLLNAKVKDMIYARRFPANALQTAIGRSGWMSIAANPRVELQLDGSNGWMGALVTETCIQLLRTVSLQR